MGDAGHSKRFAFDVGWVFASSVIAQGLAFAMRAVIGRSMGAEELGVYSILMLIITLSRLVGGLGVKSSIIKYGAQGERRKELFSSALLLTLLLGLVSGLTIWLMQPWLEGFFDASFGSLIIVIALATPLMFIYDVQLGIFNSVRKMGVYSLGLALQSVIFVGMAAPFLLMGGGLAGTFIIMGISFLASAAVLAVTHARHWRFSLEPGRVRRDWSDLMRFGGKVFTSNLINLFNYQIDIILIGYFMTLEDVGIYSVAYIIVRFFWVIPQSVQTISYPATTELWVARRYARLRRICVDCLRYNMAILVLGTAVTFFFGRLLIALIFGDEFMGSFIPLLVLLVGTVPMGTAKSIGGSLAGIGKPEIGLKLNIISAMINTSLNLIMIPRYGILGAAGATAFSLSLYSLLLIHISAKEIGFPVPVTALLKPAGVLLLSVSLYLAFAPIAGLLVTTMAMFALFLLFFFTLVISPAEIKQVRKTLFMEK